MNNSDSNELLEAIGRAAEDWGARWTPDPDGRGGELVLPALAGLRRGLLTARLTISGGAVEARTIEEHWRLNVAAVGVLVVSAAGACVTFLWPFFPRLLPALPVAALVAVSGWFLVVHRLRTSGVEEFLATVAGE